MLPQAQLNDRQRDRRIGSAWFTADDIKRWARNRRKTPHISELSASSAFGVVLSNADLLGVKSLCELGNCIGKRCLAVHWLNRRDFMRCRFETFLSVKRGGPVRADVLVRYQNYLRHGGGRRA